MKNIRGSSKATDLEIYNDLQLHEKVTTDPDKDRLTSYMSNDKLGVSKNDDLKLLESCTTDPGKQDDSGIFCECVSNSPVDSTSPDFDMLEDTFEKKKQYFLLAPVCMISRTDSFVSCDPDKSLYEDTENDKLEKLVSNNTFDKDSCLNSPPNRNFDDLSNDSPKKVDVLFSTDTAENIAQRQVTDKYGHWVALQKDLGRTPALSDDGLEDQDKLTVWVVHEGYRNPVTWFRDTNSADVREAILCACDAIVDSGFQLVAITEFLPGTDLSIVYENVPVNSETIDIDGVSTLIVRGRVYNFEDFHTLQDRESYLLERVSNFQIPDGVENIIGNKWRRFKVPIKATLHVEAVKALRKMISGTNLLKHTRFGYPHLRQFQLTPDFKRLLWYSGAKSKGRTTVKVDEITELRLGQSTPVFAAYRLPMMDHLSFSIIYGENENSLDLTCKDETEFDAWITGLKAIICEAKGKCISKEQLLSHSHTFRKALQRNNVSVDFSEMDKISDDPRRALKDCISLPIHSISSIESKIDSINSRMQEVTTKIREIDMYKRANADKNYCLDPVEEIIGGYLPAYTDITGAEDEELEYKRMIELLDVVSSYLLAARRSLIDLQILDASVSNEKQVVVSISSSGGVVTKYTKPHEVVREQSNSPMNILEWFSGSSKTSTAPLTPEKETIMREINQLVWKAEIDLENVEDMYLRLSYRSNMITNFLRKSLVDVNNFVSDEVTKISEAVEQFSDSVTSAVIDLFGANDLFEYKQHNSDHLG